MDKPKPRPVVRPPEQSHNVVAVSLILLTAVGGGLFVLVGGGLRSTQGARVSTRLQWERRAVEIDQAIADAQR